MEAAIMANQDDPPTKSYIINGAVYTRGERVFYCKEDGSVIVTMDGYLICPMDMFTERQIKSALKRYRAR